MAKANENRVVAELGRAETPEETAARKAEQSRNYRRRKTVNNLVLSLLVTVGLTFVIVLAVPRSTAPLHKPVDLAAVGAHAQETRPETLILPVLPERWYSNTAELRTSGKDRVASWNIGIITGGEQFIGVTQGFEANDTWVSQQLAESTASAVRTIDGVDWTVYDNRNSKKDNGNIDYAVTTEAGTSTIIVHGTAVAEEFDTFLESIAPDILQIRNSGE